MLTKVAFTSLSGLDFKVRLLAFSSFSSLTLSKLIFPFHQMGHSHMTRALVEEEISSGAVVAYSFLKLTTLMPIPS